MSAWTRRPSSFTRWQRVPPTCTTATCCPSCFMRETHVWGDSAYAGQSAMIEALAPAAKDLTQKRGRGYQYLKPRQRMINRARSRVRARVEHAIGVIKRIFGFTKVRYRGIAKNANRLF